jgi:chorismate synthase
VRPLVRPRPGHADLVGVLKYNRHDIRDILERASARETAARVAAGACAKMMLETFGVTLGSWVESIGSVKIRYDQRSEREMMQAAEKSDVRCPDPAAAQKMHRAIDRVIADGDTLGGVFVVAALGLPPGLGSHVQWDRKLDMHLAGAMMSIPAIKGVAIGLGFETAGLPGSQVHDVITYRQGKGYGRKTNHAGGLEGGMTTGKPLLVKAAMKPIATLKQPLRSVDMETKKNLEAGYERSDHCAVPAAGVVGEAMVAMELVKAWQEKFGGDSLHETTANWKAYLRQVAKR